ncbi:hypothetical protein B0A55_06599 [Friedmanniomyces simplex]|uniref:Uncharacterized protein n=1 Tax=Friedmanniomyces simplex TaxID=329884 RepID=A0A4U0XGQ2_9PEZI|nr:hypothetical protein B0A55_06599 [Friedmanniomyces simplex]
MSGNPTTTDEERAHGERMVVDLGDQDAGDREVSRARVDPVPSYRPDESPVPPRYDPREAEDGPQYDAC